MLERGGVEAALVEFAGGAVLLHDEGLESNDVLGIVARIVERQLLEEPLGNKLDPLRPKRQEPHDAGMVGIRCAVLTVSLVQRALVRPCRWPYHWTCCSARHWHIGAATVEAEEEKAMPPMPFPVAGQRRPDLAASQGGAGPQNLAVMVVVVAALYFGREIFVPMALAVLLSFALAPVVSFLRRWGLPRTVAVIGVVFLAFLAISAFGVLVAGQVSQLAVSLPQYQFNIQQKIRSFRSDSAGDGVVERASEALKELSEEIEGSNDDVPGRRRPAGPLGDETEEPEPVPVQIREPELAPLQLLQSVITPLIGPLATSGVVIVFVIFMLLQREDLRDRFIRLAGASDLHRTTQALSDAANRVARYLLMQLIVNATYGIPVGLGLWLIGVPNPLLWGLLATVLRFVPYIGPVVAAILPLVLSVAVDPGWTMLLWTAALFIFLEVVSNNIVEPWLYGSSTGLSPVAIILAAIFWTWLWGPVGLLLSTPLTVCLVVLGRHVPQFGFLDVLLGSEPVLTPVESLYQRLLAGDPDEATERAEEYLDKNPLLDFYDDVAVPALALVEKDRARGVLDDQQRAIVAAGAVTLVDNLSEHEDEPAADAAEAADKVAGKPGDADKTEPADVVPEETVALGADWQDRPVLCAGGRGNLDDAAAAMLGQLVERGGIGVRRATFDAVASAHYASLDLDGVRMICLSYMNADSLAHARYLVRRLRRRTEAPILVGFWSMEREEADRRDLVKATRADYSAITLEEAIRQVREAAGLSAPGPVQAEPPLRRDPVALTQ